MARPRVFVSSTFYDLKHIRSSIENFIEDLGYEPVLSEKGSIAYNPEIPLDESCYREAQNCDIFVIIIGGRYGSPTSDENKLTEKDFFFRYKSITRKEYESALNRDIPIYILMEKNVRSEYETYKQNRNNESINYAHVDSVNIFTFIEEILNQPKNNPIQQFEKHSEIEAWLKLQWAGLFQELIRTKKNNKELKEMNLQIEELSNINTTLKRYLEEVVTNIDQDKGQELINSETKRLKEERIRINLEDHISVRNYMSHSDKPLEYVVDIFTKSKTLNQLAKIYAEDNEEYDEGKRILTHWKSSESVVSRLNEVREILGLSELKFE